MKRLSLTLIALACMPGLAASQVVEEIIARVNNQIITRSEFARSKDQLRDEVKQQDPANADKLFKTICRPSRKGRAGRRLWLRFPSREPRFSYLRIRVLRASAFPGSSDLGWRDGRLDHVA